jgi:hypothetical protein
MVFKFFSLHAASLAYLILTESPVSSKVIETKASIKKISYLTAKIFSHPTKSFKPALNDCSHHEIIQIPNMEDYPKKAKDHWLKR